MHKMSLFRKHNSDNMGVIWLPRSQQILRSKWVSEGLSLLKAIEIASKNKKIKIGKIFKNSKGGRLVQVQRALYPWMSLKAITLLQH